MKTPECSTWNIEEVEEVVPGEGGESALRRTLRRAALSRRALVCFKQGLRVRCKSTGQRAQ